MRGLQRQSGFDPYDDTGSFASVAKAVKAGTPIKGLKVWTPQAIKADKAGYAQFLREAAARKDSHGGVSLKKIGKAVGGAAAATFKVAVAPVTLTNKLVSATLGKIPVLGSVVNATNRLAALPISVTQLVLDGKGINTAVLGELKQALADVKTVGPWVQTVISFVPGIGTAASAIIAAGLALANGQSISEAMVAGVKGAIPGGPAVQAAFSVAQSAIQGKPLDQIAISALPISDQQKKLLSQGISAVKDIAAGKNVAASIAKNAIEALPPQYAKAIQVGLAVGQAKNIQEAVKIGASGAVSAIGAQVNPILKTAASLGTSKIGISKALGAAQALKAGSPALTKALTVASSKLATSSERHGFDTAVKTLAQTSGNKIAMGVARRALPNQAAINAFDSAIGVVSHVVSQNPGALAKRAGSTFVPTLARPHGIISANAPNLQQAIDSFKRNPTLLTQNPMVLASKLGTGAQTVLEAMRHVQSTRLLPWRSLSPAASRFVNRWSPLSPVKALTHGSSDTAGLDENGTHYIVAKGDSPFSIAKSLTGNGNRWVELKPLNKDKKPAIDKNVWVGEVLNLPVSWQKPVAASAPSPGPAAQTQPAPTRPVAVANSVAAPVLSVIPGVLQAKSILVAWGKTDGINQAGATDYGSSPADLSTEFGARDSMQLMAFQNWNNKTGNAKLDVDGKLGTKSLAALQNWAEVKATQVTPVVPVQSSPTITTLPEIVIEASPIPQPQMPSAPIVVSKPPELPASIPSAPVVSMPAAPPVAPPGQPATPQSVAAASPGGSKLGPALAGAAVGGTLFGLPGALLGGIAGAAMS